MNTIYEILLNKLKFIIKPDSQFIILYCILHNTQIHYKTIIYIKDKINNNVIVNLLDCFTFQKENYVRLRLFDDNDDIIKLKFSLIINKTKTLTLKRIISEININNECLNLSYLSYRKNYINLQINNNNRIIYSLSKYILNIINCKLMSFDIKNIYKISFPKNITNLIIYFNEIINLKIFNINYFNSTTINKLQIIDFKNDFNKEFEELIIKLVIKTEIKIINISFDIETQFFEYCMFKNNVNSYFNSDIVVDF